MSHLFRVFLLPKPKRFLISPYCIEAIIIIFIVKVSIHFEMCYKINQECYQFHAKSLWFIRYVTALNDNSLSKALRSAVSALPHFSYYQTLSAPKYQQISGMTLQKINLFIDIVLNINRYFNSVFPINKIRGSGNFSSVIFHNCQPNNCSLAKFIAFFLREKDYVWQFM